MSAWQAVLIKAAERLRAAGVEGAMRDARLLLAHSRGMAVERLLLEMQGEADPEVLARFEGLIARRAAREPLSHLTGSRLFWGRNFNVSRDVLDPRPETEILIHEALSAPYTRLLDLGTGSGAIAVTLLAERPQARGVAVDLSEAALQVAARNAQDLGVAERLELCRSDWFAAVEGRFDLIVSNPPYIAEVEMAGLSPEVLLHEPHMALSPGGDGLQPYRILAAQAGDYLLSGGRILVEIGPSQGQAVAGFFAAAGLQEVTILPDFDGRDRVVMARAG